MFKNLITNTTAVILANKKFNNQNKNSTNMTHFDSSHYNNIS